MRGSIRRRGNTYTAYWFTSDPATGKRVQHTKGGFVRKEPARPPNGDSAREYLNAIIGTVQDGTWRPDKRLSVKELLEDHWLPAQRSRGLRPTTIGVYELAVRSWLVPHVGGVRAAALTPKAVVDLVEILRTSTSSTGRRGLSPRSAQIAVTTLQSAYRYATANGLLASDPIRSVRPPRANRPQLQVWGPQDARTFLHGTHTDRLAWAWALLLTRGPRRGEVCGMRWDDIDLESGVWKISRTRIVAQGRAIEGTPKTAAGRRSVPLDRLLVDLLRAHKTRQAKEQLVAGEAYNAEGWLFADELGVPYYPDSLSEWFDGKVRALGLPRIRLHDTRHTAATLMLAAGVPVKVVSEMLGHASPTITLGIYAHVLPGMAEEAGAALSAKLLG